jgi:hypothetical protein
MIKLACGSTRVTQKWEPHVVSSCVCVDPEEVEGRDCLGLPFGLPFICTSGVLAMLAGYVLSGRKTDETSDGRDFAGRCPFV